VAYCRPVNEGLAAFIGIMVGVAVFLVLNVATGNFHFFQVAAGGVVGTAAYQGLKKT
jgi:hypothetical protein